MRRPDEALRDRIFKLAERMLRFGGKPVDIVERQFFFNFWCQDYLSDIEKLKQLLPSEDKPLAEVCREALHGEGFEWLSQQRPEAAQIIRELSRKYGIAWQDVLGHVMGSLPLAGYPKVEYYLPEGKELRSISLLPTSAVFIVHNPSRKDIDSLCDILRMLKLPRRSRRKPDPAKYVRRCACLCLVERANYGNRQAINEWNSRFPDLAYGQGMIVSETQPGEMQFSREKRQLSERFKRLEAGQIHFLTDIS